eukprot:TRINITY_DN8210_c0_g1_i3.p1 TRINITY_DN8210_c0_g1~~TRINITY_DN8210_c0_g1_i3.p1  ORF type:complete len:401 (+),score=69.18 TRINITY_DN8210_c0_g1_i3:76-1278(+)
MDFVADYSASARGPCKLSSFFEIFPETVVQFYNSNIERIIEIYQEEIESQKESVQEVAGNTEQYRVLLERRETELIELQSERDEIMREKESEITRITTSMSQTVKNHKNKIEELESKLLAKKDKIRALKSEKEAFRNRVQEIEDEMHMLKRQSTKRASEKSESFLIHRRNTSVDTALQSDGALAQINLISQERDRYQQMVLDREQQIGRIMKDNKEKLKKMKEEYKQKVQTENETLELRISLLTRQIQEIPTLQAEIKGCKSELDLRKAEISSLNEKIAVLIYEKTMLQIALKNDFSLRGPSLMRRSIELSGNLQDSVGVGVAGGGSGPYAGVGEALLKSGEIMRSDSTMRKNLKDAFEAVVLRLQNKLDEAGLKDKISVLDNEFKYELVRVLRDQQVLA